MKALIFLSLLAVVQTTDRKISVTSIESETCITAEEKKLYELIMAYRKEKGLKTIRLSPSLTIVSQTHAKDLVNNYKFNPEGNCNPHSWSDKGEWTACCYTSDHKQAQCMWDKPTEIAGYKSPGYEIAYYASAGANAMEGLEGWKRSPSHNALILNEGIWAKADWQAIGVGIYGAYGVVWFGQMVDETEITECPPD